MKTDRCQLTYSFLLFVVCLFASSCSDNITEKGGIEDGSLIIKIDPSEVTLLEENGDANALTVQWEWKEASPYRGNPEMNYTLEIAKAETDFKKSFYAPLGKVESKIFKVKELNEMLITHGIVGNGSKETIEARLIGSIDSYQGIRSEAIRLTVTTYLIDDSMIPPYEQIWFVGSFTNWEFEEMTRDPDNPFVFRIQKALYDDGENGNQFKFGTELNDAGNQSWFNMYHPPYAMAPISETSVLWVENDVIDNFKWQLKPEECGKLYDITLDITPGNEKMTCIEVGPAPDPDPNHILIKVFARDGQLAGTAGINGDLVNNINYWREGSITFEINDVPEEGGYQLHTSYRSYGTAGYSFAVTVNGESQGVVEIAERETTMDPDAFDVVVFDITLKKGTNTIVISGGNPDINDGWAPDFNSFTITYEECPPATSEPYTIKVFARDGQLAGTAGINGDLVNNINYWREGSITFDIEDVPTEGIYQLHTTYRSYNTDGTSFSITVNDEDKEVMEIPVTKNDFATSVLDIILIKGSNRIVISGGTPDINEGWAPDFSYFVITN